MNIHWYPIQRVNLSALPGKLRLCLLDSGSLTRHLENCCKGDFTLHLKNQDWQRPLHDERNILNIGMGKYALVREINLACKSQPWVYGRTIIPLDTLRGAERRLAYWGQRSLGDYLFSERYVTRSQFEIANISSGTLLYKLATDFSKNNKKSLWARRSIFTIRGKPLLVVEVFLYPVLLNG